MLLLLVRRRNTDEPVTVSRTFPTENSIVIETGVPVLPASPPRGQEWYWFRFRDQTSAEQIESPNRNRASVSGLGLKSHQYGLKVA